MPADRLTMRKIREILRLRWGVGLSGRKTAKSVKASPSTVSDYVNRAQLAGLSWPLPPELDDEALETLLFPPPPTSSERPAPDFQHIYRELKRKGVTLTLLWLEYRKQYPDQGYQYSQFCEHFREWRSQLDLVMRQQHIGGEKLFVDYAGQTLAITNPETGEARECAIFVATLGASSYTYVEVHESQTLKHWISAHIRAFEFFGGVVKVLVPDNLKAGVKSPCFYEPELNPTYQEMADYYGCVVIPARVRRPKDKAKVENGVLQVERWALAPLRDQTFFSTAEANIAIRERQDWLNNRPFSRLDGTRSSLFEELDKPQLLPLPEQRYVFARWKSKVGVNIDYHVVFDGHYYSAPYQLVRKKVDLRATHNTVELFHNNRRVASHLRSNERGRFTTDPAHRPPSHQTYGDWTPERLFQWALSIGENVSLLVQAVLERRRNPEQGYRSCLGILRLSETYGKDRLENACARARYFGLYTYRSVDSILKTGLDQKPWESVEEEDPFIEHENIRGPHYYN